jgi:hypothetical protein
MADKYTIGKEADQCASSAIVSLSLFKAEVAVNIISKARTGMYVSKKKSYTI